MDRPDCADAPRVRPAQLADRPFVRAVVEDRWRRPTIVSRGRVHRVDLLDALIAELGGDRVGVLTYAPGPDDLEIVTLDALRPGCGVGSALLEAAAALARARHATRVWLVTTNDNVEALAFYLRRGLRLVAVHRDALVAARRFKPTIPEVGAHGLEVRDELELELPIAP